MQAYLWVELSRRVEIVVVGTEPSLLETDRLLRAQHTQRRAHYLVS